MSCYSLTYYSYILIKYLYPFTIRGRESPAVEVNSIASSRQLNDIFVQLETILIYIVSMRRFPITITKYYIIQDEELRYVKVTQYKLKNTSTNSFIDKLHLDMYKGRGKRQGSNTSCLIGGTMLMKLISFYSCTLNYSSPLYKCFRLQILRIY